MDPTVEVLPERAGNDRDGCFGPISLLLSAINVLVSFCFSFIAKPKFKKKRFGTDKDEKEKNGKERSFKVSLLSGIYGNPESLSGNRGDEVRRRVHPGSSLVPYFPGRVVPVM